MPTKGQGVRTAQRRAESVAGDLKHLRDHMGDFSSQEVVDEMEACIHDLRNAAGRLAIVAAVLQKEIDG